MNKMIEKMWETAVVTAGREKSFATTWADVRDEFAKLLIEKCAETVFLASPDDFDDYLECKVLKLGDPDES